MEDSQQQKNPGSVISSHSLVAFSAIFVSLCALAVSIYQAKIMRETQKATAWPFIEILPSNSQAGSTLGIFNKGTGPAIIRSVSVMLEDEAYQSWDDVFETALQGEKIHYTWSTVYGRVLAPNDEVMAVQLTREDAVKVGAVLGNFSFEICYCSVYDDCWTTTLDRKTHTVEACAVDQVNGFFQ